MRLTYLSAMGNYYNILTAFCLCLIFSSPLHGQIEPKHDSVAVWIRTIDGNEYQGILEIQNSRELIIRTNNLGVVTIPMTHVRKIRQIDLKDLNSKFPSKSSAYDGRYYVGSSAMTMQKSEGYYHNSMILFNRLEYGITDWWTVGAETGFLDGNAPSAGLTTRLQIPLGTEFFHLGAKGFFGVSMDDGPGINQVLGLAPFGPADRNVTVGLGYVFRNGEVSDGSTFQVSGDFRIRRRGALVFDVNLYEAGTEGLNFYMLGGRHHFRRVGLDYAVAVVHERYWGLAFPFPWIGLTIPF